MSIAYSPGFDGGVARSLSRRGSMYGGMGSAYSQGMYDRPPVMHAASDPVRLGLLIARVQYTVTDAMP